MGLLTFPVFKDGPLPMGMQKDLKVSKASLYCFIDAHVVFVVVLRISGALFALTLDTNICRQNIEKTTQRPQILKYCGANVAQQLDTIITMAKLGHQQKH